MLRDRDQKSEQPDIGTETVHWPAAAVAFGIPDGYATMVEILDLVSDGPKGSLKLSTLRPFIKTDPALREDLISRLDSDQFFEVESAIHALEGGVELPEVQLALQKVALKYAQSSEVDLDRFTEAIETRDSFDLPEAEHIENVRTDFIHACRTNPVKLSEEAVRVLGNASASEGVIETFRQVLKMQSPPAGFRVRDEIFSVLADRRNNTPVVYYDWAVKATISQFFTAQNTLCPLSAAHYLGRLIDQPLVCTLLGNLIPDQILNGDRRSDTLSHFIMESVEIGLRKYKLPFAGPVVALVDKLRNHKFEGWRAKQQTKLLALIDQEL